MVRQRIYGLLADDEDQNDHDELRHDPVFKLLADRLPEGPDLAGQPTLSRFENAVTIADLQRLREVLLAQFLDGFSTPPTRITLDIDAFDDPTHGRQQLTFFNRRCQHDPLVEGRVCTWRRRCFKVAVEISVRARRVLLRLSSSRPHLDELFRVGALVAAPSADGGTS